MPRKTDGLYEDSSRPKKSHPVGLPVVKYGTAQPIAPAEPKEPFSFLKEETLNRNAAEQMRKSRKHE